MIFMRLASVLLGIMLVMAGAFAFVDSIQTYRDSGFSQAGDVFKDGAAVYVKVWDGSTNGSNPNFTSSQPIVVNLANGTIQINLYVYDNGGGSDNGTDGYYRGLFHVSSATWSDPLDYIKLANADIAQVKTDLDSDGNYGYFNLTADYVPPAITSCTVTPNATWLAAGQNFTVTLNGEYNGNAWFTYNNTNRSMPGNGTYTLTYTVLPGETSTAEITCWHNDTAGNENSTLTPEKLFVDTQAPVITPVSPAGGSWTKNNFVPVVFNATDAPSGVVKANVTVNAVTYNHTNSSGTFTANSALPLADGNATVNVYAEDAAGNSATATWWFLVDTVAPVANFTGPTNSTYNSSNIAFTATPYDERSPDVNCSYAWYRSNGTLAGSQALGFIANATTNTTVQALADGFYYYSYACNDRAGNNAVVATTYFTVDTTPPAIAWLAPAAGSWTNNNMTGFSFTVTDAVSGLANVSSATTSGTYALSNAGSTYNGTATVAPADGMLNITITAVDNANNTATLSSWFMVDTVAPVITVSSPANTTYTNATLNFTITPVDALSQNTSCHFASHQLTKGGTTFDYSVDTGSILNNTAFSWLPTLGDGGWYTSNYSCTDLAGNTATGAFPGFTVDTHAIWASSGSINTTLVNNASCALIDGNVEDDYSGAGIAIAQVNGTALATTWDGFNYSALFCPAGWPDGNYAVRVFVNDTVGNTDYIALGNITVDSTPPVITPLMPVNGTVYNDSAIVVNATANEPCVIWEDYIYNPADGSTGWGTSINATGELSYYAVNTGTSITNGNYTVWLNCTDLAGNIGLTANMTVFINDTTPPAAVGGVTATGGTAQVALSWPANMELDLSNYTVYYSTSSGGPYTEITTTTLMSYTQVNLSAGTTYYYIVRARDRVGNLGGASAEASATTASGGSGGPGGGPGGTSGASAPRHSDPPAALPNEEPVQLPQPPAQEPEHGTQLPATTEPVEPVAPQPTPAPEIPVVGPITGLLFQEGSLLYGLAALLALATAWIIWSVSKQQAKRKWYEK